MTKQIDNLILLPYDVFADAYVDTLVFSINNSPIPSSHKVKTYVYGKRDKISNIEIDDSTYSYVSQSSWNDIEDQKFVFDPDTIHLLKHFKEVCSQTIGDIANIKRGVLFDKALLTPENTSENSHLYFEGDVYRYRMNLKLNQWIEFGDNMKERPQEFYWFENERILLRRLVNRRQRLMSCLTDHTFITNKNLYSVLLSNKSLDTRLLLGLLNSKLYSFIYLKQVTQATKDDFPQVTIRDIRAIPVPPTEKLIEANDEMVRLVEKMLDLHKQLPSLEGQARGIVEGQIEETDRAIDALVYALYGLTEDEIAIVEDASH